MLNPAASPARASRIPVVISNETTFLYVNDAYDVHGNRNFDEESKDSSNYESTAKRSDMTNEYKREIADLFNTSFSYSRMELNRLIDNNTINFKGAPSLGFTTKLHGSFDSGNQNALVQDLKTALKTHLAEIDTLKHSCLKVEEQYHTAVTNATAELRHSMNVLYKLQEKTTSLEEAEKIQKN